MLRLIVGLMLALPLVPLANAIAQDKEPPAAKEDTAEVLALKAYETLKAHLQAQAVKQAAVNGLANMQVKQIARTGPSQAKLTLSRLDSATGDSLIVTLYFTHYDRSWTVTRIEWSSNSRDLDRLRLDHQLRGLVADLEIGQ